MRMLTNFELLKFVFAAEKNREDVLGTTNGFILPPLKLMHCDTMQIFTR